MGLPIAPSSVGILSTLCKHDPLHLVEVRDRSQYPNPRKPMHDYPKAPSVLGLLSAMCMHGRCSFSYFYHVSTLMFTRTYTKAYIHSFLSCF